MSGRVAHQPAWVKLAATAAIPAIAGILGQAMGRVLLVATGFIAIAVAPAGEDGPGTAPAATPAVRRQT